MKVKGLSWFGLALVATATVITAQSCVPFLVMGAIPVPLAVFSIWILGGKVAPVSEKWLINA